MSFSDLWLNVKLKHLEYKTRSSITKRRVILLKSFLRSLDPWRGHHWFMTVFEVTDFARFHLCPISQIILPKESLGVSQAEKQSIIEDWILAWFHWLIFLVALKRNTNDKNIVLNRRIIKWIGNIKKTSTDMV